MNEEKLREALEQALDRMETVFNHTKPDATPDDREIVAQSLWFGLEELRDVLERPVFEEAPAVSVSVVMPSGHVHTLSHVGNYDATQVWDCGTVRIAVEDGHLVTVEPITARLRNDSHRSR